MITTVIKEQPVLINKPLMLLLYQYNKDLEEPILLIEEEKHSCFGNTLEYTFYRMVGDMPNHYEKLFVLQESDTVLWFAYKLNEKDKNSI